MLTSKQRAILRGKSNTMDPVFIVGKGEIDETMIHCGYVFCDPDERTPV